MSKIKATLDSRSLFYLMFIWLVVWGAVQYWPTSYWISVNAIQVADSKVGEPVAMLVDWEPKNTASATHLATVFMWHGEGWHMVCSVISSPHEQPEAEVVHGMTLAKWTAGYCDKLEPGRYYLSTSWLIDAPAPMGDRTLAVKSNVFEVKP